MPRLVLAILLAAGLTYSLSQTLILPAVPALAHRLGTGPAGSSWLLTVYLVAAAVATPLVGKLGDIHGRGRVLAAVAAVFCVGSVVCAEGGSLPVVLAGRLLQGGVGGAFPLAYGVIRDTFPPGRVVTSIGTLSISMGVGAGFGPPLAGLVVDHAGPSAIFWLGMAGAVPALAAPLVVRETREGPRERVDVLGAALLAGVLACALLAVTQGGQWGWTSPPIAGLVAAAVALAAAWLRVERRAAQPLIDVSVLGSRTVALANAAAAFVGCGTFVTYSSVAPFAQAPPSGGYGFGLSVAASGLLLMPHGLIMILAAPLAGRLCRGLGPRATLVLGAVIGAAGSALLVPAHGGVVWLVAGVTALGLGLAFSLPGLANLIVAAVPARDVGIATGINMVARTLGMAVGAAASAAILAASVLPGGTRASEAGYVAAFALAAGASALAVACALAMPAPRAAAASELLERGATQPA